MTGTPQMAGDAEALVIEVTDAGLQVVELHDGNSFEDVQAATGTRLLPPAA